MTQQTNPIDTVMYPGARIEVTLKTDETITGLFGGFMPTKDHTFIVVTSSDLEFTNNALIPMDNVLYINFPQKLSAILNSK